MLSIFRCRSVHRRGLLLLWLIMENVLMEPTVKIIFGGDVTFAGVIAYHVQIKNCTYNESFDNIKDELNGSDLVVVNLETPLRKTNETIEPLDKEKFINMVSDIEAVNSLSSVGINIVTLANNHLQDFGDVSINHTITALESNHIRYFGLISKNKNNNKQVPLIIIKNGIKIGFLGYCLIDNEICYQSGSKIGPGIWNDKFSIREIKDLKKRVDLVIIFFHWNQEYTEYTTAANKKIILKIYPFVDLIVGCHPHIPLGHYYHKGKLVVPSLGNFLFHPKIPKNNGYLYSGGGEKIPSKKLEAAWYKVTKTLKSQSQYGKLLKVEFNKNGLIRKKSKYLPIKLGVNERHCLLVEKAKGNSKWKNVCDEKDQQCTGNDDCNELECYGVSNSL